MDGTQPLDPAQSQSREVPPPGQIGRVVIGDILRRSARRFSNRVAVTAGERQVTYAELETDANRFAHALLGTGLRPGDAVATICGNSIEMVKALFGIHRAGLVWVPINTMLGPAEMDYILAHASVRAVVVDAEMLAQPARRAALEAHGLALICIGETSGVTSVAECLVGRSIEEPNVTINDRDLAMVMYTSGTTSRPKGAMHCHLAVVMAVMSNTVEFRLCREDGITGQMPLFHCAGHVLLLSFLSVGGKVALMRGFDPLVMIRTIERDRLTFMLGLPSMYLALLDHPERPRHQLASLRLCIYAMAPMSRTLLERCIRELCREMTLTGGQTEMYPATTMAQPDRQLLRFGNYWGESTLVNETGIMADDGTLLPAGEIGELVHRGPNVMMGYLNDPEATAITRIHGWHHTGDLALVDEHGEVLFIDRKKDMIKSGGENVSSVRVEEVVLAHPAVQNAAVIGLPHPVWGEAVSVFVTLRPDATVGEDEIVEHCRTRLGGFQIPKMVRVLDVMPTTATGKLRKVELRQRYMDAFTAPSS